MATATATTSERICPLCRHAFTADDASVHLPVILPCGHVVCCECANVLVHDRARDAFVCVQCPAASNRTPLPGTGVSGLRPAADVIAAIRTNGEDTTERRIVDPELFRALARQVLGSLNLLASVLLNRDVTEHSFRPASSEDDPLRMLLDVAEPISSASERINSVLHDESYRDDDRVFTTKNLDHIIKKYKRAWTALDTLCNHMPACRIARSPDPARQGLALVPDGMFPILVVTNGVHSGIPVVVGPDEPMSAVVRRCLAITGRARGHAAIAAAVGAHRLRRGGCDHNDDLFEPDASVAGAGLTDWSVVDLIRVEHMPDPRPAVWRIATEYVKLTIARCGAILHMADEIVCYAFESGIIVAGSLVFQRTVTREHKPWVQTATMPRVAEHTDAEVISALHDVATEDASNADALDVDDTRIVNVSNTDELRRALNDARPGDDIVLQPGTYTGPFNTRAVGTRHNPVTIRGGGPGVRLIAPDGEDYALRLRSHCHAFNMDIPAPVFFG